MMTQSVSDQIEQTVEESVRDRGEVTAAAERVAAAAERIGITYAGVALSQQDDRLTVYLTRRDPVVERAALQASGLPADRVDVQLRDRSEIEQRALQARLEADADSLQDEGFRFAYFARDLQTGRQRIALRAGTDAQAQQLKMRYGPAVDVVLLANDGGGPRPAAEQGRGM